MGEFDSTTPVVQITILQDLLSIILIYVTFKRQ
jgi:hypothetical protein